MTDDLVKRLYGERCVDHDDNCCVCVVWDMQDRIEALTAENERLREALANPPKHKYWGAGEPDCPREIKCGNGELHTLRCKVCGQDNPRDQICREAL